MSFYTFLYPQYNYTYNRELVKRKRLCILLAGRCIFSQMRFVKKHKSKRKRYRKGDTRIIIFSFSSLIK